MKCYRLTCDLGIDYYPIVIIRIVLITHTLNEVHKTVYVLGPVASARIIQTNKL